MDKKDKIDFLTAVKNKKLPILTIDGRWHELFPEDEKTEDLKKLEIKVNDLLKQQGKLVNEIKDMKKVKKNLMNEIVAIMDAGSDEVGKAKTKKMEQNKQFIQELNDKLTNSMDELAEIPYIIKAANEELMAASMELFYQRLNLNKEEIQKIAVWISRVREELKVKILKKQDMEAKNSMIYTYMHDVLGVEIMETFDHNHLN
ncbi:MAG: hypothetical protein K0S47_3255 [Herbinix sp.]|jgi:hypothetical protein|nr:hypothetical protein [Herbinix sp.]